ncbi:MAG: serine hydrolase [Pseudomonadota bacterium]
MPVDQSNPARCGLSWAAKVIASGVLTTGRDPQDILNFSCNWMAAPDALMKAVIETRDPKALLELPVEIDVDRDEGLTHLQLDGEEAWARRFGDQGCIIQDGAEPTVYFEPTELTPNPIIDRFEPEDVVETSDATGLNRGELDAAIDSVFDNPMFFTNAMVVVHKGRIVAERYREPFGSETQFESWSMGKSIAATLVGVLEQRGELSLDETALFEQWREADDPRRDIRLSDILNMASGLQFTGSFGRTEDHSVKQEDGRFLDHIYVYGGGTDSYQFCIDKPLADPPGKVGRYRNCDPLLATAFVRERAVDGDIQTFLSWPQRELFDPIGVSDMLLETDPYGHFLISGHDYGRARDWARLGQLYLQRGAWEGRQLLSESFVEFVQTPAVQAWAHDPYYGGFFPTNATGLIPGAPQDTFWMSGGGRQRTLIIPSRDMVIVRLGHMAGLVFGVDEPLNAAIARIANA